MKSKILIFLFTILTMGLFLIPYSFAKDFNANDLNRVNRITSISFQDSNYQALVYFDVSDLRNISGYWNISISRFNDDFTIRTFDVDYSILWVDNSSYYFGTLINENNCIYYYYYTDNGFSNNSNNASLFIDLRFSSSGAYDVFKNSKQYLNIFVYRSTSLNAKPCFNNSFIGNSFYSSFVDRGIFSHSNVQLRYYGSNSYTDITDSTLYYNFFAFNTYYSNLIINTNNNYSNGNYYLRFYFNQKIKYLSNFNLSYLELLHLSLNGSYYSSFTDAKNALPILSTDMQLYNDNSTLFNTNDLVNSGYGDYTLDYIDFRLADYSFKSSTYFNSSFGINGYINNTSIRAISIDTQSVYNTGFSIGFEHGKTDGYNDGYNDGLSSSGSNFDHMMLSVANVPMTIISSMLGFEILGVNLLSFFMGIITLLLFVKLMRKFKE